MRFCWALLFILRLTHHITSYYTTLHHITPHHITSHHSTLHHTTPRRIKSSSRHLMSVNTKFWKRYVDSNVSIICTNAIKLFIFPNALNLSKFRIPFAIDIEQEDKGRSEFFERDKPSRKT